MPVQQHNIGRKVYVQLKQAIITDCTRFGLQRLHSAVPNSYLVSQSPGKEFLVPLICQLARAAMKLNSLIWYIACVSKLQRPSSLDDFYCQVIITRKRKMKKEDEKITLKREKTNGRPLAHHHRVRGAADIQRLRKQKN